MVYYDGYTPMFACCNILFVKYVSFKTSIKSDIDTIALNNEPYHVIHIVTLRCYSVVASIEW